uniref:C2H2-type domain-containing protein n=1 Tax=Esox lucius TaxID=8010 RepID=A0A3P8XSA4_ESOLU
MRTQLKDYRESEPTSVPQHPTIVNPECSAAQSEMGVVGSMEKHFDQVQSKRTNMLKGQVSHINTTGSKSSDLFLLKSPSQMNATPCCKVCGKSFHQMGSLFKHIQIHTKEKEKLSRFCCNFCGKFFTQNGTLKTHMRIHTGEKPYRCPYCCWEFITGGDLKNHIRIHTGEKPFCCPDCGKSFTRSGHLKRHRRTHTVDK